MLNPEQQVSPKVIGSNIVLILDWEYDLDITPEDFIFADFLQGEYITLTIQDISGPNVIGQFTINFENTTEKFLTGSVDLTTG